MAAFTTCIIQPLVSPPSQEALVVPWASAPPQTRRYFKDAPSLASYPQLTNPCAAISRVKSHAGIAGNQCADAVAKYQATQVNANIADTGMPCAGIGDNPFNDITWLASERDIPSDAATPRPSNLPAPKLVFF